MAQKFNAALSVLLVRLKRFFRPKLSEEELAQWLLECERLLKEGNPAPLPAGEGVASWVALREVGREAAVYVWATAGYEFVSDELRELRQELGSVDARVIDRIREAPPPGLAS